MSDGAGNLVPWLAAAAVCGVALWGWTFSLSKATSQLPLSPSRRALVAVVAVLAGAAPLLVIWVVCSTADWQFAQQILAVFGGVVAGVLGAILTVGAWIVAAELAGAPRERCWPLAAHLIGFSLLTMPIFTPMVAIVLRYLFPGQYNSS